jgi:uncharacterized protein (DUF4415 family)
MKGSTMAKRAGLQSALQAAKKPSSSTAKKATKGASSRRAGRPAKSANSIGAGIRSGADWERFRHRTDKEIRAGIAADPDAAPELGEAWFAKAVVISPETKELISMRIDPDVLAWFKARGKGYQTRMNAVLRAYVKAQTR